MNRKKPMKHMKPTELPWQDAFKKASVRVGFILTLTRPMLEYLCAISDGVQWDRRFGGLAVPDNWIASECSLMKRGLIVRAPKEEIAGRVGESHKDGRFAEWSACDLTPAGKLVVELVKLAGIFIEADAAINKKSRRA